LSIVLGSTPVTAKAIDGATVADGVGSGVLVGASVAVGSIVAPGASTLDVGVGSGA
jgi:hypothetical protein